jgi:hypothetical protein
MVDWPQRYRDDIGITERICPHGVGHPDPDDIFAQDHVHGCDGCCQEQETENTDAIEEVSWFRRLKAWIRRNLCEEYHFDLADHYVQMMGEMETLEQEVVSLQEWVRLAKQAMTLHAEVREIQETKIEILSQLLAIED